MKFNYNLVFSYLVLSIITVGVFTRESIYRSTLGKNVKTHLIGNENSLLSQFFENDAQKYLNKKEISDLLC